MKFHLPSFNLDIRQKSDNGNLLLFNDTPVAQPALLFKYLSYVGMKEIAGRIHNPDIVAFFANIGEEWIQNDETGWCAAMHGSLLKDIGANVEPSLLARGYLDQIDEIEKPVLGCTAIYWRVEEDSIWGHIGLWVGEDRSGNDYVIGGNQNNMVKISPYGKYRALKYGVHR